MVFLIERPDKKSEGIKLFSHCCIRPFDCILIHSLNLFKQIMKMDQIKLSEEALSFKQYIADMTDMRSLIQSKSIFNYLSNLV